MNEKEKQENLQKFILEESKKGNVVWMGVEGLRGASLQDFIEQPADGILYDLNLLPEQITFDNPKGVSEFAAAQTIRALKAKLEDNEQPTKKRNNTHNRRDKRPAN